VTLGNSIEFAVATYAIFKLGAILNPLNPSFNATQVEKALRHLQTRHLIISAETKLIRKPPRSNVSILKHLVPGITGSKIDSEIVPSLQNVILVDNSDGRINPDELRATIPFEYLQEMEISQALPDQDLHKDDVVNIQFTSVSLNRLNYTTDVSTED
jgi:acyl-CoA synthetase (AMP-forming)/AMP-acid ligase II